MLAAIITSLVLGRALFGQSLVDNAKHQATEEGGKELLDIQWMLVGHRTKNASDHMLAISGDGKIMVSGGDIDRTVKVWDIERHVLKRTIVCRDCKDMSYVDVNINGTQVLAGTKSALFVYDIATGKLVHWLSYSFRIVDAMFTAYGTLAVRDDAGVITVADPGSKQIITKIASSKNIQRLPMSPDRRYAFGFGSKVVSHYDEALKRTVYEEQGLFKWVDLANGDVTGYSIGAGFFTIVDHWVSLKENRLCNVDLLSKRIFNIPYLKEYNVYGPQVNYIHHLTKIIPSYDGGCLMLLDWDYSLQKPVAEIYDSDSMNLLCRLPNLSFSDQELASSGYQKLSFALGPLGVYLFGGNSEYRGGMNVARPPTIELWTENGLRTRRFLDNGSAITDIVVSGDGGLFAVATSEGRLKVYERQTGAFIQFIDCPPVFWSGQMIPAPMQDLVVSKDFVAGASPGPHVFVRALGKKDIKAKHLIDPETGWEDTPVMCGYDEGKKILVATPKSKLGLRLMETVSGKLLKTYEPKVPLAKVVRAGDYVVGIGGRTLYVWNIETGELANKIENDYVAFCSLAFSKKRIYAGSADGTIASYDLLTGKPSMEFKGHEAPIIAMGISPDGRTLVSRSNDALEEFPLRVWDVESGKLLHKYGEEVGPMEPIFQSGNAIRFTPDGKYFLFGRGDGSVVYVKLDSSMPPEEPKEIDKPKVVVESN